MNSQKEIVQLIKAISGQANILTTPRIYVDILKSHRAALLLSQCVYWSNKTDDSDGWFFKSYKDWNYELGLNQHALDTAANLLRQLELIETKLKKSGTTPKNHWRVNFEKLTEVITLHLAEPSKSDLAEPSKSDLEENYKPSIIKTTSSKTTISRKRETDPLSKSPQVLKYRTVTGRYPNKTLYSRIIESIGEHQEDDLRQAFTEWCARGYNPNSINWLEWLKTGIPVKFPVNNAQRKTVAQRELDRINGESENDILGFFSNL